jgi:photosystem II stability/assembly factor-like uncharacterized protein
MREAGGFFRQKRWRGPGPFTNERYLAAQSQLRQMAHYSLAQQRYVGDVPRDASVGSWQPIGPDNTAGRVKALVINPNNPAIMYAAAATGGIWNTNNSGGSWQPLTDSLPTLAFSSLAMDPTNPNVLYAGSGEQVPGVGIFKTSDGGKTWTQLAPTTGLSYVYSIAVSPSRPANLYAAADSGVWASSDGGASWANSLPASGGCFSVVVRGDQPADIAFASCSQAHGYPLVGLRSEIYADDTGGIYAVYRGDMSSGKWQMVLSDPNMSATVLATAPSAPNTIYALASNGDVSSSFYRGLLGLYASDQGGVSGTWELRADTSQPNSLTANMLSYPLDPPACTQNAYGGHFGHYSGWNLGLAVDPTNSQTLFAAGVQLMRSTDGGQTFAGLSPNFTANPVFLTDFHAWAFQPGYNAASNQNIYVTGDDGIYLSSAAGTLTEYPLAEEDFCGRPYYLLAGETLNSGLQIAQFYHGAVTPGGGVYLGGSQDTVVLLASAASPGQWTPIYGGDGGMVAFDPVDPNTMYFEYQHLSLAKSTDGGNTQIPVISGVNESVSDFPFLTYFALDPGNPQTLYMGGYQLWRSMDGAQTWTAISQNNGAAITAIAVNPLDSGQLLYGDINGVIYKGAGQIGGRLRWSNSRPRSGYVSRIVFDAAHPGTVYATYATFREQATDTEVYVSTDGGSTWSSAIGAGLPDIPVHVLAIDPSQTSTLYVGTDLGIFASFNSGQTWAFDSSLQKVIVESLQIDRNGGSEYLYAFTYGRGLWRVNLTPNAAACTYSVSQSNFSVDGNGGGLLSVQVNTAPGCAWSASSILSSPYVRIQSPAGGIGPGPLYFMASANYQGYSRVLHLAIQDQTVDIVQTSAAQTARSFGSLAGAATIPSLPYYRADPSALFTPTPQSPIHSCTGSADMTAEWYVYTPTANQRVDAISAAGASPVVVTAYPRQNGGLGNEIGCATNGATPSVSPSLQFDVTAGATYAIEISGVGQTLGLAGAMAFMLQQLPVVSISGAGQVAPGETAQFAASVAGTPNQAVRWSARYGVIDRDGNYTAPANVKQSERLTDTITATSFVDPNAAAAAVIAVVKAHGHK